MMKSKVLIDMIFQSINFLIFSWLLVKVISLLAGEGIIS